MAQTEYMANYEKENLRQIRLKINRKTEPDLLDWIEEQENIQGYIKELIMRDMEEKKMYSVTLSNRETIFDSISGLKTVEEALEAAKGRGDRYVVQIARGNGAGISLSYNSDEDKFRYYDGDEWITVDVKDIEGMLD